MVTRRAFLACAAAAFRGAAAAPASLEFTHLTDTHVMRLDGVDERLVKRRQHYAHTREALPGLLRQLKQTHNAEFVLHTGDAIDVYSFLGADGGAVRGQVEAFAEIVKGSPLSVYVALGNHDVQHYGATLAADQSVAEQAKAAWIQALPCFRNGTYYTFQRTAGRTRWRFVVLNNGYYGALPGRKTPAHDGGVDQGQLDWLAGEVRRYPDDPLILGFHVPLQEAAWKQVSAALGPRRHLTVLFTGHVHTANAILDLPSASAPCFHVSTRAYGQGAGHWRRVRLLEDGLEVFQTGHPDTLDRLLKLV